MACYEADEGRFLAEISKVEYQGEDEVKSEMQYGTIIVKSRKYNHHIYNVKDIDKGKSSIKNGDLLRLIGPVSAIDCPSGNLLIEVDLFFGTYKETFRVNWLPIERDCDGCFYDVKTIAFEDSGKISIHFGMFYEAVEAKIEVMLLQKLWRPTVDVASVFASHKRKDDTKFSSVLYSNPGGSEVKGNSWKVTPLSRYIVVVPVKKKLLIDIVLSNGNEHTLNFVVNEDKVKYLSEDDYDIKANVIWNPVRETEPDWNEFCHCSDESDEDQLCKD